ncbi:MAG: DNA polymerase IV [Clostridiales bacterium]|nr:DNA polymerase IV [Clostridiales bacterium]
MERIILHIDMNNFYASVESELNPSLRGHPIAVCGSPAERHGIVLAKNYIAKGFGVKTGEAVWQARSKCPGILFVKPHYSEYMKYSEFARDIYASYTDRVEPYGMDECWIDVTGSGGAKNGAKIADEIRERIKSELGITVSIGVSWNKIFSKLGSDMKKPDAVTCICRDNYKEKVWPLAASEMLGVGRSVEAALLKNGIITIGDLANASEEFLCQKFGKIGLALKLYATGEEHSEVISCCSDIPVKSVGHGNTAMQDLCDCSEVWPFILDPSQDVGARLHELNKRAGGISVTIRDNRLKFREWQCQLPVPTQSQSVIAGYAYELFEKNYKWQLPIRALVVRAINLTDSENPLQYSVFCDSADTARIESLDEAVTGIRSRFGDLSIKHAIIYGNVKIPPSGGSNIVMPTGMLS